MTNARTMFRVALLGLLALVAVNPARAQEDPKFDPKTLTTPPLRRVQVPQPERYVMPNGIVVFLLESHDLPVVRASARFKASPLWVPGEKAGLDGLTGEVIRSGGSAAHSGDWLDDRMAAIGARISSSVSADQASGGFRCLTDNTGEVVALFAEVLRAPAFPADKIELSKVGLRQGIASRNDEMFPILSRVAMEAVYGKDSPYARKPEYATVEAITREDCQKLHARVFQPNRMVLAVYGDFKSAEMKKLLAEKFGDWKKGDDAAVPPPPTPGAAKPRLVFAPKEDVTQAGIVICHLGWRADDPDYAAMTVFEMALGGGFQSRLMNKIRTERGLAYATGTGAGADYARPGVFLAFSLTRTDSALTALDLLRQETTKVTEAPFTDAELKVAKESVVNGLVFSFAEPSAILFRSAFFELTGYPLDFLERYQKALEGVNAATVLEAAKRKVHPGQFVAVVVGKEKELEKPLESVGLAVERADISIPPPASKVAAGEASPAALAKGQALLRKAADLTGGSAAWGAIKSISMNSDDVLTMQGQSMAMTSVTHWRMPDRYVATRKLAMGELVQGFDGTNGWMSGMGQLRDEPKAGEELRKQYERSFFRLFGEPGAYQVQALDEPKTVDGVTCSVALIKSETTRDWLVYFAPDGALARMEFMGEGMGGGPAKTAVVYGDWKPAGNIQYPHSEKMLVDDKPAMDAKVTSLTLNPTLADDLFKKPAAK
jgi:predicted Zn-dependent peptidase